MAVIKGLEALKKPCRVVITTDSKYVLSGITEWMPNWKKRNWKTASKKPVLNAELWRRLDAWRLSMRSVGNGSRGTVDIWKTK